MKDHLKKNVFHQKKKNGPPTVFFSTPSKKIFWTPLSEKSILIPSISFFLFMAMVILSASVKRFTVSHIRDFFLRMFFKGYPWSQIEFPVRLNVKFFKTLIWVFRDLWGWGVPQLYFINLLCCLMPKRCSNT